MLQGERDQSHSHAALAFASSQVTAIERAPWRTPEPARSREESKAQDQPPMDTDLEPISWAPRTGVFLLLGEVYWSHIAG